MLGVEKFRKFKGHNKGPFVSTDGGRTRAKRYPPSTFSKLGHNELR